MDSNRFWDDGPIHMLTLGWLCGQLQLAGCDERTTIAIMAAAIYLAAQQAASEHENLPKL